MNELTILNLICEWRGGGRGRGWGEEKKKKKSRDNRNDTIQLVASIF